MFGENLHLPESVRQSLMGIIEEFSIRDTARSEGASQDSGGSAGITALFAGPRRRDKVLAAEDLAREINRDLVRADLGAVVSKYIGETERNLERVLNDASAADAVLLLEEADALFGKRSEVKDSHDRFANVHVTHLMQRIETYDGLAILATNRRTNIDQAFVRRLRFVVEFPRTRRAAHEQAETG